ncbi:hypothetical protein EVA_01723 [gut metagenome]|uniref:Uncharacterized protein n=1 Tax=gut metagenome TaxID=749906 RepID=J9GPL8_9ZZZZ
MHHGFAFYSEASFCVTHGGSRVTVHRTKVTLSVDQGITHIPRLCHTHQCAINGAVAMGVDTYRVRHRQYGQTYG